MIGMWSIVREDNVVFFQGLDFITWRRICLMHLDSVTSH